MAETDTTIDAQIIARAFADRVADLFKVFVEAVATGEPDRDAVVRFKRGLMSARRVRDLALQVAQEDASTAV